MKNWYLVQGGRIVTRFGDQLPAVYRDANGVDVQLAGRSTAELAAMGWLEGVETEPLPFDSETHKGFFQPRVPEGLDDYAATWRAALEGGKPLPVPQVIDEFVVEELSEEEVGAIREHRLREVRSARNYELLRSDRMMLLDSPVADDFKGLAAWKKYRQQLRDLPAKVEDPAKVKWPKAPDGHGPGDAAE